MITRDQLGLRIVCTAGRERTRVKKRKRKLPFVLIYSSAQCCTIGKLYRFDMTLHFTVELLGQPIVSMECGALQKRQEMRQKAFQGAGMSSRCIYHLLVLPLLSCWGGWVTHTHSPWLSARLCSHSLIPPILISLFLFFGLFIISPHPPVLHLSLSFHLPLGLLLGIPWVPEGWAWVWKPLIGINGCALRSSSSLLGGAEPGLKKEERGSGREKPRGFGRGKRDTQIGVDRERLHIKGPFVHY